ncbi:26S proteasome regulatory subunit N3 [Pancytospora philotis]|nr:26S proteasome regulatory subunit N3 [Pancytospora philotis]
MENFKAVVEGMELFRDSDEMVDLYQGSFDSIVREVQPELILEAMQSFQGDSMVLAPLYAGALFEARRFQDIYDFLDGVDMSGADASPDYYNGKLLKYYYQCLKYLGKGIAPLYRLLVSNTEYRNEYSTSVLTNSILDYQINNGIYTKLPRAVGEAGAPLDPVEESRYAFYLGIIDLVRGDYEAALDAFSRADILNKSRAMELMLKKYFIVCKLLLSDYSIYYPYTEELTPYFSLIGVVRRAEIGAFHSIIEQHREEFASLNLYFVVRRLLSNLLQEGLRRVSVCYSRISVADISRTLGVDADYLLHSAISSKFIKGYVEHGVYYSKSGAGKATGIGESIREVIGVRKNIQDMMEYPAIVPLSYEVILEKEAKMSN